MQQRQVHRAALGLLQQATVGGDEYGDARRPQRFDQSTNTVGGPGPLGCRLLPPGSGLAGSVR